MAHARALALLAILACSSAGCVPSVAAAAPTPAPAPTDWSTTHAQGTITRVHVELVRGAVEVLRRPGAVVIVATKVAGERRDAAVRVRSRRAGNVLRVFDAYPPPRPGPPEECHPPIDERGGYWNSDSAVKVVVSAPDGVRVDYYIMAGGGNR